MKNKNIGATKEEVKVINVVIVTIIATLLLLGLFGTFSNDCNNTTKSYYSEYQTCMDNSELVINAWEDYTAALQDYCYVDPYNNICIALGY